MYDRCITFTGAFGEIVVDAERPCVRSLRLRQRDGELGVKSLLSAWPSETLGKLYKVIRTHHDTSITEMA